MDNFDIVYLISSIVGFLLIMSSVYFLTMLVMKNVKNKTFESNRLKFIVMLSWAQLIMVESIQKNAAFYIQVMIVTFIFLFLVNYLISLIKFKSKLILFMFSCLLYIYSIAQRYVVIFRGSPFSLADLSAIKTAASVANQYNFMPTVEMIVGTVILIIIGLIIGKIKITKTEKKEKLFVAFILILYIVFMSFISYDKEHLILIFDCTGWNQSLVFQRNGCLGNLYVDAIFSKFQFPKDYDEEKIESTLDKIKIEEVIDSPKAVNIICILEESFFDLEVIKDLDLNKDNLEFYHSLDENTIKGYTVVSAYGGGTANSEFEFLTNGNMAFLADASYPFTKDIKEQHHSLASALKDLNYNTIAYHPYLKNSWNREHVYPLLGFDTYYDYVDRFNENTEASLLRGLLSDKADFKELIKIYNEKDEGSNLFLYNVTIQNHAGYEDDFGLTDIYSNKYDNLALSQYLTLVKKSDDAIKELIEYFDKVDEPTLICIFGDHIPGQIDEILDCNAYFLSGDEKLSEYRTPFLIHTNYDIDEKYYENISLSYLSTLVMDYANLPKTKEQTFVQSFMDDYPIINGWGYKYKNNWYDSNNLTDDLKLYRDYTYYAFKKNKK